MALLAQIIDSEEEMDVSEALYAMAFACRRDSVGDRGATVQATNLVVGSWTTIGYGKSVSGHRPNARS